MINWSSYGIVISLQTRIHSSIALSTERLSRKVRQHKAGAVDILVVVAAQPLLLLARPGAHGLAHVAARVFAADHEADLAGRIGGNGGVGVLGDGEDLLAGLLEVGDQLEVEPLVLGCRQKGTSSAKPSP